MGNRKSAGHLAALFTIIIWGTTFISTKVLLADFRPVEILFFRFVMGFAVLLLAYPRRMKGVPVTMPEQKSLRLGDGLNFTGGEQTIPEYLKEMEERNIEDDREIMESAIGRNNENLYLSGTEERYAIYQIKDNSEERGYRLDRKSTRLNSSHMA